MLIPSSKPLNSKTVNESQYHWEIPNKIMQMPNPATAISNFLPCCFFKGNKVKPITTRIEPISAAAFSQPKPTGPAFKISRAKTGIIATAPPNNTANKSRERAPNTSLVEKTKRNPSFTLSRVFFSPFAFRGGLVFNWKRKANPVNTNMQIISKAPVFPNPTIKKPTRA